MGAIRGAICAENSVQDISDKAAELIAAILSENGLQTDDVEAIIFSATSDLDKCYPAKAVRECLNMRNTAFMCLAEMFVEGSLDHCLRACVLTSKVSQANCKHCYIGKAKCLRDDL